MLSSTLVSADQQSGPELGRMKLLDTFRLQSSLRVSRLIALVLLLGVATVVFTVGLSAVWIARQHDRLAAEASMRMVQGGITTLDETLQTISLDFAIWPAAVDAILRDDREWAWENYGISVVDTETTDLMILVPPGGAAPYGWSKESSSEPEIGLLPDPVMDAILAELDDIPILDRKAATAYFQVGSQFWLLSSARIVTNEPKDVPTDDAQIPKLIFGFKVTEDLFSQIGASFLINDLRLDSQLGEGLGAIPLRDLDGAPVAFSVWTPPKPGAEILRQLAVPLGLGLGLLTIVALLAANLVIRSARRLEKALVEANAANKAKTEFLANVSHELRTPMNGIMGIGALLQRGAVSPEQKKMTGMLMESADTQMRLISDLLDITQIESGQTLLSREQFAPAEVVRGVCDVMNLQARQKGLSLELDLPADGTGPTVFGDKGRFQQIVTNLINNAIKFTETGSVSVGFVVTQTQGALATRLSIRDTGPGIADEHRERIFERFFQVDSSMTRKIGGTGLGLSITKSLTDLMGGTLSLESVPGTGSTFIVDLKFEAPEAEPGDTRLSSQAQSA